MNGPRSYHFQPYFKEFVLEVCDTSPFFNLSSPFMIYMDCWGCEKKSESISLAWEFPDGEYRSLGDAGGNADTIDV